MTPGRNNLRVLVAVPCLALPGGVASYYRALRPYLGAGIEYFEVGARPGETGSAAALRRLAGDYWRFFRQLGRADYDLVHVNPSLGPRAVLRDGLLILLARLRGRRVLVFFRGWDPACAALIGARHRRLFRWVHGQAHASIVLAEEFRATLREWGLTAPVHVETTVVDDLFWTPADAGSDAPHAGPAVCRVLYLGRLDHGKGVLGAIAAFGRAWRRSPTLELIVAGDGPERVEAEAAAARAAPGAVRFIGHVDGIAKLHAFRSADIYLFTSAAEGMPNSVLEAMAAGLPVVTTPVGGLRDFFVDGRMGCVVPVGDADAGAAALERMAADPAARRAIGDDNRDYARGRFAAPVVAARLLDIYAQVIRDNGAH